MRDAPQSISIIPREIIEQQSASTLRDVLRNVSGISMAAGEGGGGPAGDNLTLRGFGARNDIFVDGIRDFASYTRDTFNVEQVEVVKGPASAQTGRGSTGGYINLFSKQPEAAQLRRRHASASARPISCASRPTSTSASATSGVAGAALRVNALLSQCRHAGPRLCREPSAGASRRRSRVGLGTVDARDPVLRLARCRTMSPTMASRSCRRRTPAWPSIATSPAPVDYDNYYGLLERDRENLRSNLVTFALEHDLTDARAHLEHHALRPCDARFDLFVAALRQQHDQR